MVDLDNLYFKDDNKICDIMDMYRFRDFVENGMAMREAYEKQGWHWGFISLPDGYKLVIMTKNPLKGVLHVL